MAKVSIIIPVYNTEDEYLRACIESVQAQMLDEIDIIMIDDGSGQHTAMLCDELCAKYDNITVKHISNGGVSNARNIGLEMVKTEYFCFVDSDDIIHEQCIKFLYDSIIKNNADIAVTYLTADESGTGVLSKNIICWNDDEGIKNALLDHPGTHSACGKIYRTDLFGEIRFDTDAKIHEDSFFVFMCLCKASSVIVTDSYLYRYRIHGGSASHAEFGDKYYSILDLAKRKLEIIDALYPKYKNEANNLLLRAHIAFGNAVLRSSDQKAHKKIYKENYAEIKRLKGYFIPLGRRDKILFVLLCRMHGVYKFLYGRLAGK